MSNIIVEIPKELHEAFKIHCIRTGLTMSDTIRGWIKASVATTQPTVVTRVHVNVGVESSEVPAKEDFNWGA